MIFIDANGANIPAIGFGTWPLKGAQATDQVANALGSGYRHIDTAAFYENEEAVGEGLRKSGVARGDIFLTTKVWPTNIAEGDLQASVEASLKRLGTDYLDLALIHWPSKTIPMADSIGALNEVHDRGLARNIGVSNFTLSHIEEAVKLTKTPLACNQVENHPFIDQSHILGACRSHNMALVSYCPLSRATEAFVNPVIAGLAEKYGKTAAQIILRWQVQEPGRAAIPRSSDPGRAAQNLNVFDFELEPEDFEAVNGLRSGNLRICDFDFSPEWDAPPA